jgi:hypothetical protein
VTAADVKACICMKVEIDMLEPRLLEEVGALFVTALIPNIFLKNIAKIALGVAF